MTHGPQHSSDWEETPTVMQTDIQQEQQQETREVWYHVCPNAVYQTSPQTNPMPEAASPHEPFDYLSARSSSHRQYPVSPAAHPYPTPTSNPQSFGHQHVPLQCCFTGQSPYYQALAQQSQNTNMHQSSGVPQMPQQCSFTGHSTYYQALAQQPQSSNAPYSPVTTAGLDTRS